MSASHILVLTKDALDFLQGQLVQVINNVILEWLAYLNPIIRFKLHANLIPKLDKIVLVTLNVKLDQFAGINQ